MTTMTTTTTTTAETKTERADGALLLVRDGAHGVEVRVWDRDGGWPRLEVDAASIEEAVRRLRQEAAWAPLGTPTVDAPLAEWAAQALGACRT